MAITLKEIPVAERPRERLMQLGAEKLTDAELIAILLRTGIKGQSAVNLAQKLLAHCEGLGGLSHLLQLRGVDAKKTVPGIGQVKMCQILAGLHLGFRTASNKVKIVDLSNPRAVFEHLAPLMSDLDHEEFCVVLLNAKNHVLEIATISQGTLTASLVHPREIFRPAIRRSAHAVILAHNHPSGDPTPSREDREVTQRLIESGKLLGIEVLDHLVIGRGRYTSFRERGLADFS